MLQGRVRSTGGYRRTAHGGVFVREGGGSRRIVHLASSLRHHTNKFRTPTAHFTNTRTHLNLVPLLRRCVRGLALAHSRWYHRQHVFKLHLTNGDRPLLYLPHTAHVCLFRDGRMKGMG